jgi:hypothetical protein
MADKSVSPKHKQVKQDNQDTTVITRTVLNALNSSEGVKSCFKPSDLGLKSGAGTYVVIMESGVSYRLQISVTRAEFGDS